MKIAFLCYFTVFILLCVFYANSNPMYLVRILLTVSASALYSAVLLAIEIGK